MSSFATEHIHLVSSIYLQDYLHFLLAIYHSHISRIKIDHLMPLENAHISLTHTLWCQISFSINLISLDKVQIMQLIDGFWPLWYLSLYKYLSCLWPDQYRSDRQNHTWTCLNKKQPWKHDRPLFYISLSNEIVKHWSVCCQVL